MSFNVWHASLAAFHLHTNIIYFLVFSLTPPLGPHSLLPYLHIILFHGSITNEK